MPFFEKGNLKLYYEDVGSGEAIIANHGLMEDAGYWSETGVTAKLAEKYRVISMDMRGHGRTVVSGDPLGFDADAMAGDFDALADHLGLGRFHILTHATGGMAGVRYAMTRSSRLISLMLTDTGSATMPSFPGVDQETFKVLWAEAAKRIKTMTLEERIARAHAEPGPFLFKMAERPDSDQLWPIYEHCLARGNAETYGAFMENFYSDPDPRVGGLRQVACPTLILLGEFDVVFLEPSAIMAKEIPDNRHVILPGVGHMTAIEAPEATIGELLDFLETVKKTGKAAR